MKKAEAIVELRLNRIISKIKYLPNEEMEAEKNVTILHGHQ